MILIYNGKDEEYGLKTLLEAMINSYFKSVTFYGEYVVMTSKHHSQYMLSFLLPVIQVTSLSEKWMLLISFH